MRKYTLENMIPETMITSMKACDQNNPHHFGNVYEHTKAALEYYVDKYAAEESVDEVVCYAIALHDLGKTVRKEVDENGVDHFYGHATISESMADEFVHQMYTDDDANKILRLIKVHERNLPENKKSYKKFKEQLEEVGLSTLDFVDMREADLHGQANPEESLKELENFEASSWEWDNELIAEKRREEFRKMMPVNAQDIMKLGITGSGISKALNDCLNNYICNYSYWKEQGFDDEYIKNELIRIITAKDEQ